MHDAESRKLKLKINFFMTVVLEFSVCTKIQLEMGLQKTEMLKEI